MSILKKKGKTIPQGSYRIIKIGKDAIYEVLRKYIIENQETFFDVTDGTKIVKHFDINWDTGEFFCAARNDYGENEYFQCNVDTAEFLLKLQDTTETLFTEKRYIELSEEKIKNL